jgi:hypothetical protein
MKVLIFWKPTIWLAVISYLSLIPGGNFPIIPLFNFPGFDKIVHAGFYFVLCILSIRPFSKITIYPYFLSFILSSIVGGVIEILQASLTTTRHLDFFDFLANLAGAATGIFFYRLFISGKKIERII